jgi:hypothetical protein
VSCDLLIIDAHELGAARQKIFIADRFEPNNDPAIVAMATGCREMQSELKMFQDRVGALAPLWWLTWSTNGRSKMFRVQIQAQTTCSYKRTKDRSNGEDVSEHSATALDVARVYSQNRNASGEARYL